MDTGMNRFDLGRIAFFGLALAFGMAPEALGTAQDAESVEEQKSIETEISELTTELETRRAEINELAAGIEKAADRATALIMEGELSERRAEYRRDLETLVDLVLKGEEEGAEVEKGRRTATELLEAEAPTMREHLKGQTEELIELADTVIHGKTPEERAEARDTLTETITSSTRLLKYLHANIEQRQELGLDVDRDLASLEKRLTVRSDGIAGLLKMAKQKIEELSSRPGLDKDADAQKELGTWKKQRETLAESQKVNADIMDDLGLDTAQIRRGIISSTGKLSEDILDKEVATGLAESMLADATDWVRGNGAELIFQAVSILLVLLAFWILARIGRSAVRRGLERSKLDISALAKEFFIKSTARLIMLIGVIIAIAQLGVEVGPMLAGLGIAGFVVGFALQDTLSNFASGMMILVYRPFDVGDAIEAGGVTGKVDEMNLVSTMILTFDNQLLIVPNKQVWGGIIRNITHQDKRRVDMTFSIGYADDVPKAEQVLTEVVTSHEKALKDPEPVVRLHNLGEWSVDFIVRPWSSTNDYWDVYWDVTREVKRRFDQEGISIPFPQRDVHVYRDSSEQKSASDANRQRSETEQSAQTPVPDPDDED